MKKSLLILGVLPVAALAACHNGGERADNGMAAGNTDNMVTSMPADENVSGMDANAMNGMAGNETAAAPMSGQKFVNTMAASDAYEIAAGQLAQQKATDSKLKDFGKEMVKDHNDSTEKLRKASGKATPPLTPDPSMTAEQKANLATLRSATGADFDSAYRSQQVKAHEQALAALRSYAQGGDVPALRDFADSTAKVVANHLDKIRGQ